VGGTYKRARTHLHVGGEGHGADGGRVREDARGVGVAEGVESHHEGHGGVGGPVEVLQGLREREVMERTMRERKVSEREVSERGARKKKQGPKEGG